jgi:hypothetical protein
MLTSRWRIRDSRVPRLRYLLGLWLFGGVAMALAGSICSHLGARLATAVCVFLIIIVLLSLTDSLISSLVFSIIAVGLLDYFFTAPIFSFAVDAPQDVVALVTYFIASFAITGLVRRMRDAAETLRQQAQLLELTHDTVMVRDEGRRDHLLKSRGRAALRLASRRGGRQDGAPASAHRLAGPDRRDQASAATRWAMGGRAPQYPQGRNGRGRGQAVIRPIGRIRTPDRDAGNFNLPAAGAGDAHA